MSLSQYRRELQQERERRTRTSKSISDLDQKIGRQADLLRKTTVPSTAKSRQRELERLSSQRTKAQSKLSDHDKKITRFEERVSKAEQHEQATRDAEQKRAKQLADREQSRIQSSLADLEGAAADLASRVTHLERTALDQLSAAVEDDPVDRASDVFISYAHEDADLAEALREELVGRGLDVWIDHEQLELGRSQALAIDKGLRKARCGVCIVTEHYIDGRYWTQQELAGLISGRKRIIPVVGDLSFEEVGEFSVILGDRRGLSTATHGFDEIAEMIAGALMKDSEAS